MTNLFQEYADRAETKAEILPLDVQAMCQAKAAMESVLSDAEDVLARIKAIMGQHDVCENAEDLAEGVVDTIRENIAAADKLFCEMGYGFTHPSVRLRGLSTPTQAAE